MRRSASRAALCILLSLAVLGAFDARAQDQAIDIAAGREHTCAVLADGRVRCWGGNDFGQLGDGTNVSHSKPVSVALPEPARAVAAGLYHTCALTTAGAIKCWGDNTYGQLGDGTNGARNEPVDVVGLTGGVAAIAAGAFQTCALNSSGAVLCWGNNSAGELGDGSNVGRNVPGGVAGLSSGVVAIASGFGNSAALMQGGDVKYWGLDGYEEHCYSGPWAPPGCYRTLVSTAVPKDAHLPGDADRIGVGGESTIVFNGAAYNLCAVVSGVVRCWGGWERPTNSPAVTIYGLSVGVNELSMGGNHDCVVAATVIQCWGYNSHGELGDGTTEPRGVAQVLGLPPGAAGISAGGRHTCIRTDGGVMCWGANTKGQLGDGTMLDRSTPVAVVDLAARTPPPNFQGLWWNDPAGSESGWGINVAHQGNVVFLTWFTYDHAGRAWWLSMTGDNTSENSYSGILYATTGPPLASARFDPADVVRTAVGTAVITFLDADHARFAYALKGEVQREKTLTREVFGPLPVCVFGAQPDLRLATNFQDLWWASPPESESGWGLNLTHQGDIVFATWFTYDNDGAPTWMSVTSTPRSPGVYAGTLYRTRGPSYDAQPFDPAEVVRVPVGTATFAFADGANAAFSYTVDGVSRTKAITREVFVAPGTSCK